MGCLAGFSGYVPAAVALCVPARGISSPAQAGFAGKSPSTTRPSRAQPRTVLTAAADFRYSNSQNFERSFRAADLRYSNIQHVLAPPNWLRGPLGKRWRGAIVRDKRQMFIILPREARNVDRGGCSILQKRKFPARLGACRVLRIGVSKICGTFSFRNNSRYPKCNPADVKWPYRIYVRQLGVHCFCAD